MIKYKAIEAVWKGMKSVACEGHDGALQEVPHSDMLCHH